MTKLPIPDELQKAFNDESALVAARRDDPRRHQMRKRQRPHVEGNFATLVYIEVGGGNDLPAVDALAKKAHRTLVKMAQNAAPPSAPLTLPKDTVHYCGSSQRAKEEKPNERFDSSSNGRGVEKRRRSEKGWNTNIINNDSDDSRHTIRSSDNDDKGVGLHLSLSQSFDLRQHFIDPFIAKLNDALAVINGFDLCLSGSQIDVFSNHTRDRYFAAAVPSTNWDKQNIDKLIDVVDKVAGAFGCPPLMNEKSDRQPHVSLAWTSADIKDPLDVAIEVGRLKTAKDDEDVRDQILQGETGEKATRGSDRQQKQYTRNPNKADNFRAFREQESTAGGRCQPSWWKDVRCDNNDISDSEGDTGTSAQRVVCIPVNHICVLVGKKVTRLILKDSEVYEDDKN